MSDGAAAVRLVVGLSGGKSRSAQKVEKWTSNPTAVRFVVNGRAREHTSEKKREKRGRSCPFERSKVIYTYVRGKIRNK